MRTTTTTWGPPDGRRRSIPNGDTSYNSGTVGMNCAGFVSYVLRKAGLDAETAMEVMHRTPVNQYGSGLPYDWLAGASNYKNLIENGNISAYAFRTKQELLSSGLAEKGRHHPHVVEQDPWRGRGRQSHWLFLGQL